MAQGVATIAADLEGVFNSWFWSSWGSAPAVKGIWRMEKQSHCLPASQYLFQINKTNTFKKKYLEESPWPLSVLPTISLTATSHPSVWLCLFKAFHTSGILPYVGIPYWDLPLGLLLWRFIHAIIYTDAFFLLPNDIYQLHHILFFYSSAHRK